MSLATTFYYQSSPLTHPHAVPEVREGGWEMTADSIGLSYPCYGNGWARDVCTLCIPGTQQICAVSRYEHVGLLSIERWRVQPGVVKGVGCFKYHGVHISRVVNLKNVK